MASSDEEKKAKKLLEAASSGNLRLLKEVVKELNEGQAVADKIKKIKDEMGLSAFHLAAYHGRTEICQYFIEDLGFPVDLCSENGGTPLLRAAMGGHATTARYLISCGANPVVSEREGRTPLHGAAQFGHGELVKYLLSLGVPVDITFNHLIGPPLIVAALCGQASTMEVLLQHNADVNISTSTGITPLYFSVCIGSLECTKLLIKAGADLSLKCPLTLAVFKGFIEIIKCLLVAGADPNFRNEYGFLPIETAVLSKKWDIVEMLFPLTSPLPEVHDWSVQGILLHLCSDAFRQKHEEILAKRIAKLKVNGAESFRKKEYLAAVSFYSKAIEAVSAIGSDDAALFSNRSLCWHRLGEGDRAWKDALVVQRSRPEWPKAYYRIGAAMMLLKKYEQASEAFKEGLLLDPTNMEIKKADREAVDCLMKSHFGEENEYSDVVLEFF